MMPRAFEVRLARAPADAAYLKASWQALLAVTPEASGFQSLPWVAACWEELARPGESLFITVIFGHGRIVAIFPTQLSKDGRLTFIGGQVSNYSGPLYQIEHLEDIVAAWAGYMERMPAVKSIDLSGLRDTSPFFRHLQRFSLPSWGTPLAVQTNTCPYIDLRPGWHALQARHKSKQRANWKRKWARLGQIGDLEFLETSDPGAINSVMGDLFRLYESRWAGQRNRSAAFSKRQQGFQAKVVENIRQARDIETQHIKLSMLRLDREVIAYSYGIRANGVTSSYVLAHDDLFTSYSPGLLLLLQIIEAASRRGDPAYDFSLGEMSYKELWATGQSSVYRVLWGRGRWSRSAWQRAWVAARSVEGLRRLKLQGIRALTPWAAARELAPDAPGLPAGKPDEWHSYRIQPDPETSRFVFRRWRYGQMKQQLSPRLLALALERHFRGDEMVAVEDEEGLLGVAWRACASRRRLVTRDEALDQSSEAIWYQPVPAEGRALQALVSALSEGAPYIVVSNRMLSQHERLRAFGRFSADLSFNPKEAVPT